jgi:hypothetical protein
MNEATSEFIYDESVCSKTEKLCVQMIIEFGVKNIKRKKNECWAYDNT